MQLRQQVAGQIKAIASQQKYIAHNGAAIATLEKRISDAGKNRETITYEPLFANLDVDISVTGIRDMKGFPPPPWGKKGIRPEEGRMVEEFLRLISMKSFSQHGFMASALVVYAIDSKPGPEFYALARMMEVLSPKQKPSQFFKDQKEEAFRFFETRTL